MSHAHFNNYRYVKIFFKIIKLRKILSPGFNRHIKNRRNASRIRRKIFCVNFRLNLKLKAKLHAGIPFVTLA